MTNGSQQQWVIRNSDIDGWTNGVWNQVFSGDVGAPANCFPAQASCGGPYTTIAASPVTREAPYLFVDAAGKYDVFVPAVRRNSVGTSWGGSSATAGRAIPLDRFYIAKPTDSALQINIALASGANLLFTPGVYTLDFGLILWRPDTVVLGLGFPTLVPRNGGPAMLVANPRGVQIAGLIFDAGPKTSPVLLQLGPDRLERDLGFGGWGGGGSAGDPAGLYDVFFRIGGATAGSARTSLVVNASDTILDDVWAWRADHGTGVGWTLNTADHGVVVNGDNVTAYGLFVEHFQKTEVIWNGRNGTDIFFQNEMPYDPPSQAAWMQAPGVDGYPAFEVTKRATGFNGYGMGSYSFFNQGVPVFASRAFAVPATLAPGSMHDLLTIFLNATASGGILNVIDNTGGSSTAANPSTPVTVVSYP